MPTKHTFESNREATALIKVQTLIKKYIKKMFKIKVQMLKKKKKNVKTEYPINLNSKTEKPQRIACIHLKKNSHTKLN